MQIPVRSNSADHQAGAFQTAILYNLLKTVSVDIVYCSRNELRCQSEPHLEQTSQFTLSHFQHDVTVCRHYYDLPIHSKDSRSYYMIVCLENVWQRLLGCFTSKWGLV